MRLSLDDISGAGSLSEIAGYVVHRQGRSGTLAPGGRRPSPRQVSCITACMEQISNNRAGYRRELAITTRRLLSGERASLLGPAKPPVPSVPLFTVAPESLPPAAPKWKLGLVLLGLGLLLGVLLATVVAAVAFIRWRALW